MYSIYPELTKWIEAGSKFSLATVVNTWGSAPRSIGAKMAVKGNGDMVGSVSGGCVEGAVVAACMEAIDSGMPKLLHFDVADETALKVGLACGGEIDVYISLPSPEFLKTFKQASSAEEGLSLTTLIEGDHFGCELIVEQDGSIIGSINEEIDQEIQQLPLDKTRLLTLNNGDRLFWDHISPPPKLIIVGGVHIAVALSKIARACGYQVIIIDPRRQFGTQVRFPEANHLIHLWPDQAFRQLTLTKNTALAFLTHDPKIDDPGLISALSSEAFYIGALGSRKTQHARQQRLINEGVSKEALSRIRGPIGLPLGGRGPEEIAVAIMAEIIQTRYE